MGGLCEYCNEPFVCISWEQVGLLIVQPRIPSQQGVSSSCGQLSRRSLECPLESGQRNALVKLADAARRRSAVSEITYSALAIILAKSGMSAGNVVVLLIYVYNTLL